MKETRVSASDELEDALSRPLLGRRRSDNGCASGAPSTSRPGGGRIHPLEHFLQPRAIR
jgi:hypothetical protein